MRVSSISWTLSLCPSTLRLRPSALLLLRSVRGRFTPLLRVRSISPVTLERLGTGADRTISIGAPIQILDCNPHGLVETVHVSSPDRGLQHLAYAETVFGQLHGIFVVNQLVLVELILAPTVTWVHGVMSGRRGCLISRRQRPALHPQRDEDRITPILTREDHLDREGDFMQNKGISDQTPAGLDIEVK